MLFWGEEAPKFHYEHKRLLKGLQIDANGPGTILRDFETFLAFFSQDTLPVTKTHQLPNKTLLDLNPLMARPLELGLQRPQQKAFPHLEGLYLLLRASGMTFVDNSGKGPVLVVDERALQSWQALNPTERYCTLLETWLLRGYPEIIRHDRQRVYSVQRALQNWVLLFYNIPDEGARPEPNSSLEASLYFVEMYGLALMELFGLVEIEHLPPVPGKGWQVGTLRRTALGDALCALFSLAVFGYAKRPAARESATEVEHGALQPVLRRYWPAWRKTLTLPKAEFRDGIYTFRVDVWRGVWRRISIPAKARLNTLANAILEAFRFSDTSHLYLFSYQDRTGRTVEAFHDEMESVDLWASDVAIGDLPLNIGQEMLFVFDFGDNWRFSVTLEGIAPQSSPPVKDAVVVEKHGEAPDQYRDWSSGR